MCTLNRAGQRFATLAGVSAMTDVTGFGLLGHLVEMADGSKLTAELDYSAVPRIASVEHYLSQGCVPGGTGRNFDSYGHRVSALSDDQKQLLCDPQTSGGLLVAVSPDSSHEFLAAADELGLSLEPIGQLTDAREYAVELN
jgi:selenide,water dikinase